MPTLASIGRDHAIIAMIHVGALPGTPAFRGSLEQVTAASVISRWTGRSE